MRGLRASLALAVVSAATILAFTGRWPWQRFSIAPVSSMVGDSAADTRPFAGVRLAAPTLLHLVSDTLHRGETLSAVFGRQGLGEFDLAAIFQRAGLDPRRLRAGLVVEFRKLAGENVPSHVSVRTGPAERLAVSRAADGWTAERRPISWKTDSVRFEGPIDNSLYEALDRQIPDSVLDAGNRVRLAWDLADVYAWSVDFNRDIQPGDRFVVLVERKVSEEGEVRTGAVLAADLLVSGRHQGAYRFAGPEGGSRYYDADGHSLRRAFLRAPVEFRRISSGFAGARFHPVLGLWRRHEGTDYAATSGTPVLASGDGAVVRAGWAGGYGNLIELRHRNGITTRYGHLRGFAAGIHAGARVSQGEVIGYVGSTGLATGPHLHYEFRVEGVARDSRRVNLGGGEPIAGSELALFKQERARLAAALGGAGQATVAAVAEE
jgi:murein DD-endopeptidase MepM/ murein hydrolase activator NlpD